MWFLIIGILILLLKLAGVEPVHQWGWDTHWWVFVSPFAAAAAWWFIADASGWTRRQAMDKENEKRKHRRQQQLEALGRSATGQRRR